MKRIKEKPKMGKPKEKPKSAGMPKQAARMMKEKHIRELERRPSGAEGENRYASDQVEQSGRWAADELAGTVYDCATRQGREHARKQADVSMDRPQTPPEAPPQGDGLAGDIPAESSGSWDDLPDTPREQRAERPINPLKERQTVEQRTTPAADGRRPSPRRSSVSADTKQARPHRAANPLKERPQILKERSQAEAPRPADKTTAPTTATHTPARPNKTPGDGTTLTKPSVNNQRSGLPHRPGVNSVPHVPQGVYSHTAPPSTVSAPPGKRSSAPARGRRDIKQKPPFTLSKRNAAANPGNSEKKVLTPKVRRGAFKPSAKSAPHPVTPAARAAKAAQRKMQRQMFTQAKQAARSTGTVFKKLTQAVVKAAHAMISAAAGLVWGAVLLMALVIVIVIAAVANSPFGLFFAQEPNAAGAVSVAQAVGSVNMAYNSRLELLQAGDYDTITVHGQAPDWADVLAVFAVKTAGNNADGLDVATLDADRVAMLTAVFWDMTEIAVTDETIDHPANGTTAAWTETILNITITAKTADDMSVSYGFSDYQKNALNELLADRAALTSLAGSLAITSADVREVLTALPADLDQARRDTVQTALQLVGKVNYFWGGKSRAIGWDSRWGQLTKVWAAGNSTTGTYRPFGLDCSGLVDWTFNNSQGYIIGHGGGARAQHTYCTNITQAEAQPGDLAFYPDDSHVGIIVGRNAAGKLLACHCSSGRNNVVVTEFSASGFTAVGRPDIFD